VRDVNALNVEVVWYNVGSARRVLVHDTKVILNKVLAHNIKVDILIISAWCMHYILPLCVYAYTC
jgi:hypothetical protein